MINIEYPRKKISRMKSPFQSSQMIDSEYADSRTIYQKNNKNYDQRKFPNVFQYNDRSRVMVSDSDLASSINNSSGENIYNFTPYRKQQEKVEQIDSVGQFSHHSSDYQENQKDNRFSFNPSDKFASPQSQYEKQPHNFEKGKIIYLSENFSYQNTPQGSTSKPNYDTPSVNIFTISQKPSQTSATYQGFESQVSSFSKAESANKQSIKTKQTKKTFKPKFFQQFQEQIEEQTQKFKQAQQILPSIKQDLNIKQSQSDNNLPQKQRMSMNSSLGQKNQFKQEIQDQKIDIFISPPAKNQQLLIKEKQKAKMLKSQKMNLSAGSEVHSQTQNILNHLRDQILCPNQQLQLNLSTNRNSQPFNKDVFHGKNIVQSKIFHQENPNFTQSHVPQTKMNTTKKPRKKIFQSKTQKNQDDRSFLPENRSPYVSQFERNTNSKQRDPSPSQILMKSLNIIDKMANKKSYPAQKQIRNTTESVVIVPPTLTITRSPNIPMNTYTPSSQQLSLQKQILELNFEISSFETTFDLENFDRKDQVNKIRILNDSSIQLFEKYKSLILSRRLIDSQNPFHSSLKQQILLIRESATKLLNFQDKYIQTKNILSSFEEQIKTILLLNSRQKYKKIKLLNEAIQVMGKTETYLGLQIGKIPVILKTYVTKEKLMLQEFRDWLKQCIAKQNPI